MFFRQFFLQKFNIHSICYELYRLYLLDMFLLYIISKSKVFWIKNSLNRDYRSYLILKKSCHRSNVAIRISIFLLFAFEYFPNTKKNSRIFRLLLMHSFDQCLNIKIQTVFVVVVFTGCNLIVLYVIKNVVQKAVFISLLNEFVKKKLQKKMSWYNNILIYIVQLLDVFKFKCGILIKIW